MFNNVPDITPNTTEAITIRTFSPHKLPDIPIYRVHAPKPIIVALLTLLGIPFLKSKPIDEPNITVITLTITPNIFYTCFLESITLSLANSLPLAFSNNSRS